MGSLSTQINCPVALCAFYCLAPTTAPAGGPDITKGGKETLRGECVEIWKHSPA